MKALIISAIISAIIAPIRLYQRLISPLKPVPTCRYSPTCSAYAIEAIERRGVVVGSAKALWRLLRCNPLFHGGYDPVDRRDRVHGLAHGSCPELADASGPPTESSKY